MPNKTLHHFQVDNVAMRYSNFAPRLFNFCQSLGLKPNDIMPSRAFCSDENQGYPIILIAKHFGTFPFNHGRVGGTVATNRHGPHAHHGKDLVIIQASHVGYDPDQKKFGVYRRLQTEQHEFATDCGAICGLLDWYKEEYVFACQQIQLDQTNDSSDSKKIIIIDNQLLKQDREQGLFLNTDQMIAGFDAICEYSTAKAFVAGKPLVQRMANNWPQEKTAIGTNLSPELFYFRQKIDEQIESGMLNRNLIETMPEIICSDSPALAAAQVNTQAEFDRTFRTIVKEKAYRGKKVVFVSGIHIDISPREGQLFPLTKFVPWAAYIQNENGEGYTMEQQELHDTLMHQSTENPHKIDLTEAIHQMEKEPEIILHVDDE